MRNSVEAGPLAGKFRRRSSAKIALLALIFAAMPLVQGQMGYRTHFEERALAAHNRERAMRGIPPLRWNDRLAADAGLWAEHLTRVGYLVHSKDDPADPNPEGENLWAGTRHHYQVESMVGLWAAERRNFVAGIFPANSRTGKLEDVGHYTQMIWRSTLTVGCALASGRNDDFMVCRYSEGGNVIGETPF